MKKILICTLIFYYGIFFTKTTLANKTDFKGTCQEAGSNIEHFLSASIGKIITISQLRIAPDLQNKKLEQTLFDCVDVVKVSKRVLGRAKWNSLTAQEQKHFLHEYPIYFVHLFKDITLKSIEGVKSFDYKKSNIRNMYDISLQFHDSQKQPILIQLRIETKDNMLKITDGQFLQVSIIGSQRQMFDRLYDANPNVLKNFNAKDYFNKK